VSLRKDLMAVRMQTGLDGVLGCTPSAAPPRLHPLGCDVMSPSESLDMVDEGASGVL
jgi:hypothetical protein